LWILSNFKLHGIEVLILKGLQQQGKVRFRERAGSATLLCPPQSYDTSIGLEELSWDKKKLETEVGPRFRRMECKENKQVVGVIRKLDKKTLNLYTRARAELGTREPSCIGLVMLDV
jgi:hypothetical protein